jgi:cytochrome subunit of sulfide dehydrogenase
MANNHIHFLVYKTLGDTSMMNKRASVRLATLLVASLATFAGAAASAQSKDELYVAGVSATCATCHGTQGRATNGSSVVSLAGMPAANIILQMKAFKDGSRPATVMHQLSKGYSDAQVAMIANYFAAQKK